MVVERLVAARRDETCALSLPHLHSRSPLSFSHTHKHWRRGRRTRSPARPASHPPQACSTAALPACPPRARRTPSTRPSPTARQASPLGCSPERPSLPDAPEPVGKQVFPSPPHRSLSPSTLLPPCAEGPTLGMGTPESLSLLFRRLCFSAALGRKLAPGPGLRPGSGAQGVSASPGPRPPAAFLQARGEDRLPPFPTAVAFLSASPSSATGLRAGDSGPRCSSDFSSANSPGIWRGRDRDAGGEGAQGGRGREKAAKGSPRQV